MKHILSHGSVVGPSHERHEANSCAMPACLNASSNLPYQHLCTFGAPAEQSGCSLTRQCVQSALYTSQRAQSIQSSQYKSAHVKLAMDAESFEQLQWWEAVPASIWMACGQEGPHRLGHCQAGRCPRPVHMPAPHRGQPALLLLPGSQRGHASHPPGRRSICPAVIDLMLGLRIGACFMMLPPWHQADNGVTRGLPSSESWPRS